MVAQLAPIYDPLPLLVEPLKPAENAVKSYGWVRERDRLGRPWARRHDHDAFGAGLQHLIARYLIQGVERQEIARETGYSERAIQAWLVGRAWEPYTKAMLKALADMGIGHRRGLRPGKWAEKPTRAAEIVMAQRAALDKVILLLGRDTREGARELVLAARILAAGQEPVRLP